ncbi:conserved hypothetical protein [Kribbella flavida DSM 17836]|uniref:Peptidase M14 domain-containing protein n=1 Tax=Kribbella flavida (strain DSM 17836 / JCM 10339 / NBRC 14399) TaxID=479435 RepID=D2PSE2_KRIFD|nr:M14 family zinc carboxypeptidase [Kribbella flavida]ADB33080.1 conserved hypothetical protein [Kribbella flavida DSM 17836]
MNINDLLGQVSRYPSFPGPDEVDRRLLALADRHPESVRRRRLGVSRRGEEIHLVSVGAGRHQALVVAGPHANEPVGFLTVPSLAELLCSETSALGPLAADYTWHFIGCIDPDAARLNEGWYAGPFTRRHYARNLYRPPLTEQIEWSFPGDGSGADAPPESRALMQAIDTIRPDLLVSLHNGEFGGVFYYLTRELPGLAEALTELDVGIPLHLGDPELPGARPIAPGVYLAPTAADVNTAVTTTGTSSLDYAARHGTLSLVVEVPLWSDPRSCDLTGSGIPLSDVLTEAADLLDGVPAAIGSRLDPATTSLAAPTSPFVRSVADVRRTVAGLAAALRGHAGDQHREATTAEWFGWQQTAHLFRLRGCGTALRLLDGELAVGNHSPAVRQAHEELSALFDQWASAADATAPDHQIPLTNLLRAQLAAILTTATFVAVV